MLIRILQFGNMELDHPRKVQVKNFIWKMNLSSASIKKIAKNQQNHCWPNQVRWIFNNKYVLQFHMIDFFFDKLWPNKIWQRYNLTILGCAFVIKWSQGLKPGTFTQPANQQPNCRCIIIYHSRILLKSQTEILVEHEYLIQRGF
jgi:hypothetical protein